MIECTTNFCLSCENVSIKFLTWHLFTGRQPLNIFLISLLNNNCILPLNLCKINKIQDKAVIFYWKKNKTKKGPCSCLSWLNFPAICFNWSKWNLNLFRCSTWVAGEMGEGLVQPLISSCRAQTHLVKTQKWKPIEMCVQFSVNCTTKWENIICLIIFTFSKCICCWLALRTSMVISYWYTIGSLWAKCKTLCMFLVLLFH